MHELLITENILEIALKTAREAGAKQITGITLVIGDLSTYVDDSVQFYFDFLSKDTIAEGAFLHFRREPAMATCQACHARLKVTPPLPPVCPVCQSPALLVSGGKDFYIESIEVDS